MTKHETEPDAAKVALWRDDQGFSINKETEPGSRVYFTMGPDDLSHALYCEFVQERGNLACSCDASRGLHPGDSRRSWWYRCWLRWMGARVRPEEKRRRVPWPVEGPDGDPWVEGVDFTGDDELTPGPAAPIGSTKVEWGVQDKLGFHAVQSDSHARRIVENMRDVDYDPDAAVVCREVTEWRKADNFD